MKISICFLLLMLSLSTLLAQPFQIHGTVRDGASGDLLPYAHIYVKPDGLGVVCNDYGFFSLSTKSKSLELKVSFKCIRKQKKALSQAETPISYG